MGQILDSVATGIQDAWQAPVDLVQGDTRGFGTHLAGAVGESIHAVHSIPVVGPYIGPAVAGFFGGPLGYAAASGLEHGFEAARAGQSPGKAALGGAENAGISYAAGQLGSAAGTAAGNYAGNALSDTAASGIGNTLSNSAANTATTAIGDNAIGNTAGNFLTQALGTGSLASNIGTGLGHIAANNATAFIPPTPGLPGLPGFTPSRTDAGAAPGSFSQFAGQPQDQMTSNIANKGVYGGGNSPDESKYFLNLVNNQLVDPNGHVNDMSSLSPIESSYLSKLGLGGYGNSTDLLKGISNYA